MAGKDSEIPEGVEDVVRPELLELLKNDHNPDPFEFEHKKRMSVIRHDIERRTSEVDSLGTRRGGPLRSPINRVESATVIANLDLLLDQASALEIIDRSKIKPKPRQDGLSLRARLLQEAMTAPSIDFEGQKKSSVGGSSAEQSSTAEDGKAERAPRVTDADMQGGLYRDVGGKMKAVRGILRGSVLEYHCDAERSSGSLNLGECMLVRPKRKGFLFSLQHPHNTFTFLVEQESEWKEWINAISVRCKINPKFSPLDPGTPSGSRKFGTVKARKGTFIPSPPPPPPAEAKSASPTESSIPPPSPVAQSGATSAGVQDSPADMVGFLWKSEGLRGRPKEYFFTLRGLTFSYSETELDGATDEPVVRTYSFGLSEYDVIQKSKAKKPSFVLQHILTRKTFTLHADEPIELESWLYALRKAKDQNYTHKTGLAPLVAKGKVPSLDSIAPPPPPPSDEASAPATTLADSQPEEEFEESSMTPVGPPPGLSVDVGEMGEDADVEEEIPEEIPDDRKADDMVLGDAGDAGALLDAALESVEPDEVEPACETDAGYDDEPPPPDTIAPPLLSEDDVIPPLEPEDSTAPAVAQGLPPPPPGLPHKGSFGPPPAGPAPQRTASPPVGPAPQRSGAPPVGPAPQRTSAPPAGPAPQQTFAPSAGLPRTSIPQSVTQTDLEEGALMIQRAKETGRLRPGDAGREKRLLELFLKQRAAERDVEEKGRLERESQRELRARREAAAREAALLAERQRNRAKRQAEKPTLQGSCRLNTAEGPRIFLVLNSSKGTLSIYKYRRVGNELVLNTGDKECFCGELKLRDFVLTKREEAPCLVVLPLIKSATGSGGMRLHFERYPEYAQWRREVHGLTATCSANYKEGRLQVSSASPHIGRVLSVVLVDAQLCWRASSESDQFDGSVSLVAHRLAYSPGNAAGGKFYFSLVPEAQDESELFFASPSEELLREWVGAVAKSLLRLRQGSSV